MPISVTGEAATYTGNKTISGNLTVTGSLILTTSSSKLVPGATSFAVRNNADSANNLLVSDAGVVTTRSDLSVGGNLTFTTATTRVVPGSSSFAIRNNANTTDHFSIASNGDVTVGVGSLSMAGSIVTNAGSGGGIQAPTGYIRAGAGALIKCSYTPALSADTTTQYTYLTMQSQATNGLCVIDMYRSTSRVATFGITDNASTVVGGRTVTTTDFKFGIPSTIQVVFTTSGDIYCNGAIVGNGNLYHGTAALATNATTGFHGVPSCAGAPTGVPSSVPTGQIPTVIDSTNSKLYAYIGGSWKSVTLA